MMKPADIARLVLLAAIWGASFLLLRVLVPVLGTFLTVELRVLIAGLALLVWLKARGVDCGWRKYWKQYVIIGGVNSALPFFLLAFGALHMPSSYEVILNSTAPLFGAIFSALWLGDRLTGRKLFSLLTGALGVALVAGIQAPGNDPKFGIAVAACLGGAACYGIAGIYIRKHAAGVTPAAMAACSQLTAAAMLSPSLLAFPSVPAFTPLILGDMLALALLCSAVAYLLYFRLIADVGPARALTVTFLMPGFGMLWGALFLQEQITLPMIAGTILIVAGTAGVFKPAKPPPLAAEA